jgi:hypothetical protein
LLAAITKIELGNLQFDSYGRVPRRALSPSAGGLQHLRLESIAMSAG